MSQTLADPAARADRWVEAPVTYLADLSVKPVTYNPPQGSGAPRRDGNYRRFAGGYISSGRWRHQRN